MRESCIHHPTQQPVAIVRQDYYYLMNRDTIAAAILNIFEYWANGAIATQGNKAAENPWVGIHTIPEIQELLVGIATDKHIRERLKTLEENGFIERRKSRLGGRSYEYRFNIKAVQESLETLAKSGQTTAINPVKRPQSIRSNDRNNPVKRPEQSGQTTGSLYIRKIKKIRRIIRRGIKTKKQRHRKQKF